MAETVNPYQSPTTASGAQDLAVADPERGSWRLVAAWAGAVLANAVVGLAMMGSVVAADGRWAVAAGIACVIATGAIVVRRSSWIGQSLTMGGFVVALTQVFPILHIIAGSIAVGLAQPGLSVANDFGDFQLTPRRAFLATVITGFIIMAAGGVVGLVLRLLFGGRRGATAIAPEVGANDASR